jgi:nuclear RNA export factor
VIKFDLEDEQFSIPIIKPGFSCNEEARKVVMTFIEQYMRLYDSDNRHALMDAYHEDAVFTLGSTYNKPGNISTDHPSNK